MNCEPNSRIMSRCNHVERFFHDSFAIISKEANPTTVSKKNNWDTNVNCRPVIILSNVSKILERVIFLQLSDYRETLFTCSQCKYAILLAILTLPTPYISEI